MKSYFNVHLNMKLEYDTSKFRFCGKHGLLSIDQFMKSYAQRKNGKKYNIFKCLACIRERSKTQYHKNPSVDKIQTNKWRAKHRKQARAIVAKCYIKNKEKYLPKARERTRKVRLECLKAYSPELKCSLCPENHDEFMVLDHIDGGGTEHRKQTGSGSKFYFWIKKNHFPSGYRVLCHNCNFKELLRRNEKEIAEKERTKNLHKTRIRNGKERLVNKQKAQAAYRKYHKSNRIKCIKHYSNEMKCICCGNSDVEVLSIDHIDGGGRKHMKELGVSSGNQFYSWLIKNHFPEGYRILCLNCNFSFGAYGHCHHQQYP